MSTLPDNVFDMALSLPQSQRADLAFQLLQSLEPPGDDISADEFRTELHERIDAYRRGEVSSASLEEAPTMIRQQLSAHQSQ
jgi:putative addiction module component (TIGR02574 family)